MNIDENTAVVNETVSEQSADAQAQETTTALDEFMADTEESTEDVQETEATETESEQTTETETEEVPKGIKGRILKAEEKADKRGYDRAQSEWANQKAEYERIISEYRTKEAEAEIEKEAAKLARAEHVSVDFAKRLLRAERGMTAPAAPEKPVASKTENPVLTEQRKTQLNSQVAQIKDRYGIEVMDYVTDDDAKAIFAGSMDLWEIALRAGGEKKAPAPKATHPTPVRSGSTTAPVGGMDFSTMSDEEFDKFNAKISRGAVFKPRK